MFNYDTEIAELLYVETCICDTPLCNLENHMPDFYCHGGDFDLEFIQRNPSFLNETHDCYTNREQCFIMHYRGSRVQGVRKIAAITFLLQQLVGKKGSDLAVRHSSLKMFPLKFGLN